MVTLIPLFKSILKDGLQSSREPLEATISGNWGGEIADRSVGLLMGFSRVLCCVTIIVILADYIETHESGQMFDLSPMVPVVQSFLSIHCTWTPMTGEMQCLTQLSTPSRAVIEPQQCFVSVCRGHVAWHISRSSHTPCMVWQSPSPQTPCMTMHVAVACLQTCGQN